MSANVLKHIKSDEETNQLEKVRKICEMRIFEFFLFFPLCANFTEWFSEKFFLKSKSQDSRQKVTPKRKFCGEIPRKNNDSTSEKAKKIGKKKNKNVGV